MSYIFISKKRPPAPLLFARWRLSFRTSHVSSTHHTMPMLECNPVSPTAVSVYRPSHSDPMLGPAASRPEDPAHLPMIRGASGSLP